jgi:hypothetical protein
MPELGPIFKCSGCSELDVKMAEMALFYRLKKLSQASDPDGLQIFFKIDHLARSVLNLTSEPAYYKMYNPPSLGGVEIREIHATFFISPESSPAIDRLLRT